MKTGCAKFLRVEYNRRITETGINELLACIDTHCAASFDALPNPLSRSRSCETRGEESHGLRRPITFLKDVRVMSWPANRQLMHCHCGLARILHQAQATPNATRSWCGLKRNGARVRLL
jgi:hypothetical protein